MKLIKFLPLYLLILYLKGLFAGQLCFKGRPSCSHGIKRFSRKVIEIPSLNGEIIKLCSSQDKIASGTFGEVFHAITNEGDCFALKVTDKTNCSFNEIQIFENLAQHYSNTERIIRFYGHTKTNNKIHMVLELGGPNLLDYFKEMINKQNERGTILAYQNNTLTEDGEYLLTNIIKGAALALLEFHRYGGIHMDIKPQNFVIKIGEQNQSNIINSKLIDFGYSLLGKESTLIERNDIGTDLYIAPEIINNNEITNKVDIYSFGVMIYKLRNSLKVPFTINELNNFKRYLQNNSKTSLERVMRACFKINTNNRPTISAISKFLLKECNIFNFEENMPIREELINEGQVVWC